jgi:hypothetical protein
MLQLWKYQAHSSCPRCGAEKENTEHVIKCTNTSASTMWTSAIQTLRKWMEDNDGQPDMIEIICARLDVWRSNTPLQLPQTAIPQVVMDAMMEQDSIGWNNFVSGFISKKWVVIQQAYLSDIGSMRSPILWISRFQKRIWEIPWQLWQHRNEFLHNDGKTIHFKEAAAINNEIRKELNISGHGLPDKYQHLFQLSLEDRLKQPIEIKRDWLMSVWVARDHHSPTQVGQRNKIAEGFYLRWKKKFE